MSAKRRQATGALGTDLAPWFPSSRGRSTLAALAMLRDKVNGRVTLAVMPTASGKEAQFRETKLSAAGQ